MDSTHRPLPILLVTAEDGYAARVAALLDGPVPECVARLDEALLYLSGAAVDCVLLDLELPELDGSEAVKRIVTASPRTSVVVLTTAADDAQTLKLIRAGAHDFAAKESADGGALAQAVRHAVERRRAAERLEVERLMREVAADVRPHASPPARNHRTAVALAAAAVLVAIGVEIAVDRQLGRPAVGRGARGRGRDRVAGHQPGRHDADLLQSIIEGSSDGLVVKDLEGRYLLANDAARRMLGLPGDVVGRTDPDLFDADEAASQRARDEAVLATGEARRYWRNVSDEDTQRTLSLVKAPHRDATGKIVGLIGTVRDETDMRQPRGGDGPLLRPRSRHALHDRRRRAARARERSLDRGARLDRRRVARPAVLDFVHPEDRVRAGHEIELMLSGASDGWTNRLATRAGGWRDVEWTARVAPDSPRIYAVVRDVTDRNAMQGALAAGEARYRTLVHSIPNSAVLTFDHDLRFTFAAGDSLARAGVETGVVGRTLAEVFPELVPMLTPRYRAALGGHAQSFEFP